MTGGAVRFWFRGDVVELSDVRTTQSVLHWLREGGRSRGTKEGCNQGDCGACTVVLAERGPDGVRLRTANACLLLVPMLHGRALFTVEDVSDGDELHPVQSAMVDHGGSQCGFCTPGIVMSLWCATERCAAEGTTPDRDDLAESLTGNLCRCTGYRPILAAAVDAAAAPRAGRHLDLVDLGEVLDRLDAAPHSIDHGASGFLAPTSERDLATALAGNPSSRVVAGGTDLALALREVDHDVVLVSTDAVAGLAAITADDTHLRIGAAARLDDTWAALAGRAPALARMGARFASPAIRSTGTIGGNLVNASPIADLTPVLLALDASVVVRSTEGERVLPLDGFATGVRRTVLAPGEYLARVDVPLSAFDRTLRAYKLSRRFDDDISTVSAVLALETHGGRIDDVRVVLGGMAPTVRRAAAVERVLRGRLWDHEALLAAQAALASDFSPIGDHRASASYRERAARGLVERWWYETGVDAPSVPVDVWATT